MTNDLISRSALLEAFGEEPLVWDSRDREDVQMRNDWLDYTKLVKEAPAVDAVEVVRCKDCKYYESTHYGHMCKCWEAWLPTTVYFIREDDDFCSYGEKRSGEHE